MGFNYLLFLFKHTQIQRCYFLRKGGLLVANFGVFCCFQVQEIFPQMRAALAKLSKRQLLPVRVKSKSGCEQPQISYANDICRLGRLMWL